MRHITILTGLPEVLDGPLSQGVLRIAREKGLVEVRIVNLRDHTEDRHRTIDDQPYGGGPGMVLMVEPVAEALRSLPEPGGRREVLLLTPQGEPLTQERVEELAEIPDLVLLCGRYKGVDERVRAFVTAELSLGDFVISGGELAAAVVADAVVRLLPGVLGCYDSALGDSFTSGILDCAYYTRPEVFEGARVPEILLSGHHEKIEEWRRRDALRRTLARRPELLKGVDLTDEERSFLRGIGWKGDAGSEG